MDKKRGFTLSEVLITLGVIGVVAAITIPMLMSHYNKYLVETRLKAVYSTILQGIKMAQYNETALLDSKGDDGDVNGFSYRRSKEVFEAMFLPVFSGCTLCRCCRAGMPELYTRRMRRAFRRPSPRRFQGQTSRDGCRSSP